MLCGSEGVFCKDEDVISTILWVEACRHTFSGLLAAAELVDPAGILSTCHWAQGTRHSHENESTGKGCKKKSRRCRRGTARIVNASKDTPQRETLAWPARTRTATRRVDFYEYSASIVTKVSAIFWERTQPNYRRHVFIKNVYVFIKKCIRRLSNEDHPRANLNLFATFSIFATGAPFRSRFEPQPK